MTKPASLIISQLCKDGNLPLKSVGLDYATFGSPSRLTVALEHVSPANISLLRQKSRCLYRSSEAWYMCLLGGPPRQIRPSRARFTHKPTPAHLSQQASIPEPWILSSFDLEEDSRAISCLSRASFTSNGKPAGIDEQVGLPIF